MLAPWKKSYEKPRKHIKKAETKVHIVRAMVFPVVMYGYESWLSAKELMLLNRGAAEHPFESPLNSKEIKPVNHKGNQP